MTNTFINSAKVTIKSQVTIPKDVREILGVTTGDQVSFIVEGNTVFLVNSAVYAMQVFQKEMAGIAKRKKLKSEADIMKLVKKTRKKKNG